MQTLRISRNITWNGTLTEKAAALCRMFGLTADHLADRTATYACALTVRPGDVVLVTGPSGSGKTVLMNELQQATPTENRISLSRITLPDDCSVIDCIDANLIKSIRLLSTAGLNDVFCLLNQPANLSEGEQYRYRLAVALSLGKRFVFADEFCSADKPNKLLLRTIYLDEGTSSWTLSYDACDGMKEALRVAHSGSGQWREATAVVPDAAMRGRGPRGADLVLASRDGDAVFHLIEVEKRGLPHATPQNDQTR